MKCEQIQFLLSAYLDGEVTPSEQALIQAHLSSCTDCQQELNLLSTARSRIRSTLQSRASHAAPGGDAWNRLEKSLTEAGRPSSRFEARSLHPAPDAGRASIYKIFGGVTMHKRLIASAFGALAVIFIVAFFLARNVTQVSAQQILERASQAQSQPGPTQGIAHTRTETYSNYQALSEKPGLDTIMDSYSDLQTGIFRLVITDSKTGKVLDASAYDGTYTYSQDPNIPQSGDVPLTIYRAPQNQVDLKPVTALPTAPDAQDLFNGIRNDPNVKFIGKETWADGRTVYVLQSHQLVKVEVPAGQERPNGLVTTYFDVNTYEQLGYRMTMEKDGQEILLGSQKVLENEVLPVGSKVVWDLSDVQGITVVDDPNREHTDLLPEVITPQELAAKAQKAYLLKSVPEGYKLEITAPPRQNANDPFIYIASYRTEANDYFVIEAADIFPDNPSVDETYTTTSGLILQFAKDESDPSGKHYVSAYVKAPDGVTFMINSTLPRETVKAWAENLAPVK